MTFWEWTNSLEGVSLEENRKTKPTRTQRGSGRAQLGLRVREDGGNARKLIAADKTSDRETARGTTDGTDDCADGAANNGDAREVTNNREVDGERGGERAESDGREDGDGGEGEHLYERVW